MAYEPPIKAIKVCRTKPPHLGQKPPAGGSDGSKALGVMQEMHHIAIFNQISLTLSPHLTRLLSTLLPATGDVVVKGNGFGPDEPTLEIAMDHAGSLQREGAFSDRPCAGFSWAAGEISL